MSEEIKDNSKQGQPKVEAKSSRKPNGTMRSGFNQYTEARFKNVGSEPQEQPTGGEYSMMNTILMKQTGMSAEKFVEYQRRYSPRDLFIQLSFLADNVETPPSGQKQGLPPNQDFVPTSPGSEKVSLPGKPIGTQRMGKKEKFGLHIAFDPVKLFTPKKK